MHTVAIKRPHQLALNFPNNINSIVLYVLASFISHSCPVLLLLVVDYIVA
jgi:hypothetical protein